jgi:hypothetical protein
MESTANDTCLAPIVTATNDPIQPTNCSRELLWHDPTSGGQGALFGHNQITGPNSQTFNFIPRPTVDDVDELGFTNNWTFDFVHPCAADDATRLGYNSMEFGNMVDPMWHTNPPGGLTFGGPTPYQTGADDSFSLAPC